MGVLYKSTCYSSAIDAADSYFANQSPSQFVDSKDTYYTQFEKIDNFWQLVTYKVINTNLTKISQTNAVSPSFSTCDTMAGFNDGLELGWLVVGIFFAVYAFVLMKRAAR